MGAHRCRKNALSRSPTSAFAPIRGSGDRTWPAVIPRGAVLRASRAAEPAMTFTAWMVFEVLFPLTAEAHTASAATQDTGGECRKGESQFLFDVNDRSLVSTVILNLFF